jgi:hypothetical protein
VLGIAFGCAPRAEPAGLALALSDLSDAGLPHDVSALRVQYQLGDAAVTHTVSVEELESGGGRRELTLDDLAPGEPLSVRVEGLLAGGKLGYVGSLGPLSLVPGEALTQRIALSPAGRSVLLDGSGSASLPGRFLHASAVLPDGRVLISGGFGPPAAADCPAAAPRGALCFQVTARADAWLFDPSAAVFHRVDGGMLEPRGGHSLSALPDGRLLVAGGARAALLVFEDPALRVPRLLALDASGRAAASASFELFEPDPFGSKLRDASRGRFVGRADAPSAPGALLVPRFLHAAAADPRAPGQVLLAGGWGAERSSQSYELFDVDRPGGYGSTATSSGALLEARVRPAALGLGTAEDGAIWLFGGRYARAAAEIAERWVHPSAMAPATLDPATQAGFPDPAAESEPDAAPEDAFPLALAARFDDRRALVAAALPPYCGSARAPSFPATSLVSDDALCAAQAASRHCFVLDGAKGKALGCELASPHLLGAATALGGGEVLVGGGLRKLDGAPALALERIALSSAGKAVSKGHQNLASPRALHTTSPLPTGGALSVGGLELATPAAPALAPSAELVRW